MKKKIALPFVYVRHFPQYCAGECFDAPGQKLVYVSRLLDILTLDRFTEAIEYQAFAGPSLMSEIKMSSSLPKTLCAIIKRLTPKYDE